jgi:exopolysaccharide/PEP-CTERM locus tyrosine autokinase
MSLIEDAAKRLEELRRSGVEVHENAGWEAGDARVADLLDPKTPVARAVAAADAAGHQPRTVTIDLGKLEADGYITPDATRTATADEFRVIKRPLIANASGKSAAPIRNGNLIMVTSSLPNEGKTFTAVNLAISMAIELDRTVLLVDADVARPSLPKLLGLPATKGLLDVLQDKSVDIARVLLHTNIAKLSILPGGGQTARATEILASDAMSRLLEEMARRYADRIIIFDAPPILPTTEARVLASQMGQIVFVVQAETTRQSDVNSALAAIEACPVKLLVLNMVGSKAQGAYGYGYGYGS